MAWIMNTYSTREGYSVPGVVTGKPLSIGGSAGRSMATARGVMYVTLATLKHLGMSVEEARVVVQGFGNVGGGTVELLHLQGCRIVGASHTDVIGIRTCDLDVPKTSVERCLPSLSIRRNLIDKVISRARCVSDGTAGHACTAFFCIGPPQRADFTQPANPTDLDVGGVGFSCNRSVLRNPCDPAFNFPPGD